MLALAGNSELVYDVAASIEATVDILAKKRRHFETKLDC